MQHVMGHENQMASLYTPAQRRNHFVIQALKMDLGCLDERLFKATGILDMQSNPRELELQAMQ